MHLIDRTAVGHMLAVAATGKIALYQAFLGGSLILTLPVAWLFVRLQWGIYATGWAMILTMMLCAWGRVWFARTIAGMSARLWLRNILLPLALLFAVTFCVGWLLRLVLLPSLSRVGMTTLVCELTLLGFSWIFLLDASEREVVRRKLVRMKERVWE